MALGTYAELQASLANWMARSGDTVVTGIAPDAIAMAEAHFNRTLRLREMETTATLSAVSGVATLPTGFQAVRRLSITGYSPLKLVTPEWAQENYAVNQASTLGGFYTIVGSTLTTYPAYTGSLSLIYYTSVPALAANSTNWLLTSHPDLYLAQSLGQINAFTMKADVAGLWFSQAQAIIDELNKQDVSARYSNAAVRVKGPTP